jgi:hypothetical protein
MGWQSVPGVALIIACLTAGGLIREGAAHVYYGKPPPANLTPFQKQLLHRDVQLAEEEARRQQQQQQQQQQHA